MQRRGVLTGAVIVLQLAGDGGTVLLFSVYRVRSIYHIPSTLVVDHGTSDGASSSHRDIPDSTGFRGKISTH